MRGSVNKVTVMHATRAWLPRTENWVYYQIKFLPSRVKPVVVCETWENRSEFPFSDVFCFQEASSPRYWFDVALRRLGIRTYLGFYVSIAKRYRAQILHSHFGPTGCMNSGAAKKAGIHHVVTFYGFDVNQLPSQEEIWRKRYLALFRECSAILCEGPHMAKCLVRLGCPESKLRIHHLGANLERIPFCPRTFNPSEPLRILLAATFQEKKGIPDALEALGQLQSTIPLEITIIGDANQELKSQAEKRRILAVIERHGLSRKTRMMGFQPYTALMNEACNHHIFLAPSITASDGDTEGGLPVTLIEMLASGMPVISTHHCDIPELIHHGKTGLLVREHAVQDLKSQIVWLLEHPQDWLALVTRGRRLVEQEFNAETQGQRLANIYDSLLADRSYC